MTEGYAVGDDGHPLFGVRRIDGPVEPHLEANGEVFASFLEQDSGSRSYGVRVGDERWFVKASWRADAVESLRRAIDLHRSITHPSIIPLRHVVTTTSGLALVYPWVDGEVLYGAPVGGRQQRLHPAGPHARFRALAIAEVLNALDAVYDAHLAISNGGYVAVDLYDGCFIYDFERRQMWLCDLDEYRTGPFVVTVDRLPGSTRFMAPEEWQAGAVVDERTTVFNLARAASVLLDDGDGDGHFRGTAAAEAVLARATEPDADARYPTVRSFVAAWRKAVGPRRTPALE